MARKNRTWMGAALVAVMAGLGSGCVAAAAAGAGAGGGIYFTSRGVGSQVNGSVDEVAARAQSVLASEGVAITDTKTEASGDKRVFQGKKNDLDVSVELERQGPTATKAEVSARKNLVEWDKDYAQKVMDRIVKGG